MKILVINAGSSSLKYQLMDSESGEVFAKGLCERIGIDGRLTHKVPGRDNVVSEIPMPTHNEAIAAVIEVLLDPVKGVIKDVSEIDAIGHRVVHGATEFAESCLIDDDCIAAVERCIPLGPLHNPANLMGIAACRKLMPGKKNVAVFDTAFHMTMPEEAFIYAVPYEYYEQDGVRRYGFHGTSHNYVKDRCLKMLGKTDAKGTKIVTCHLGNGSSLCAVKDGKSVDTSMGLGPLAGVPMGTRSGDLDPTVLDFIMNKHGYDMKEMMNIVNKKSGMLGISGVSSDFRDLSDAAEKGNKRAELARKVFAYDVKKTIGAYAAAMGGLDAIVFTAGVGENDVEMRASIMEGLEFLGAKLDPEKNNTRGDDREISTADSKVKVFVIPTNEELMIAMDTARLAK